MDELRRLRLSWRICDLQRATTVSSYWKIIVQMCY